MLPCREVMLQRSIASYYPWLPCVPNNNHIVEYTGSMSTKPCNNQLWKWRHEIITTHGVCWYACSNDNLLYNSHSTYINNHVIYIYPPLHSLSVTEQTTIPMKEHCLSHSVQLGHKNDPTSSNNWSYTVTEHIRQ